VGLPGSGKGEASRVAGQYGLTVLVMGDVIRQEAARLGLSPTDQNLGRVGAELRAAEGPDAVAKRVLKKAEATGQEVVVVDGLRSLHEAEFFRGQAEEFHLVEVCAPVEARLKWLEARGRPDDPGRGKKGPQSKADLSRSKEGQGATENDSKIIASCREPGKLAAALLEQRECRELSWGMCEAMKTADYKLRNDGNLDEFHENVKKLLRLLLSGPPDRFA